MNEIQDNILKHLEQALRSGVQYVRREPTRPLLEAVTVADHSSKEQPPSAVEPSALTQLNRHVASCARCPELFSTRQHVVLGKGAVQPKLCFVGLAPEAEEDNSGELLSGVSGQLLRKIVQAMGLSETEVYYTLAVKCRPPQDRPPRLEECLNCAEYLHEELRQLQSPYLCSLGEQASRVVLRSDAPWPDLRGRLHFLGEQTVLCTFSPKEMIAEPALKGRCWEDLKMLLLAMGRSIPRGH